MDAYGTNVYLLTLLHTKEDLVAVGTTHLQKYETIVNE